MRFPFTARSGWWRDAGLLLPLAAAVWFVHKFARGLPLTDEWFYVHALRRLHDVDFGTLAGWAEAWRLYPAKFNDHLVVVPFWFYWPVAELTHFDSRWAIAWTVAAFAGQVLVYRRWLIGSAAAALPVALVMFCPSHFMEFLWGWQLTLTFSVVFPLLGLALLDGLDARDDWPARARCLAAGLGCVLLGVFSSAGAWFAFAGAILMFALKPMAWRVKAVAIAVSAAVAAGIYLGLMHTGPQHVVFGRREIWDVLTAFGAALWGSPVGLTEFGFDGRSAGGLAIVACTAAVVARAAWRRLLPKLALALGITLVGYLCMMSIAISRPYLGNWHVQYALPALCGGYAAAWVLWREDRSWWAGVPFVALAALLTSCLYGYYKGITDYGPDYLRYIHSIENYQLRNLVAPGQPTPYPPQGKNDMDGRLFLFLSAHEHPLFDKQAAPRALTALPGGAQVFLDESALATPVELKIDGRGKIAWLTVLVPETPGAAAWRGVRAQIGGKTLMLRRVHPDHVPAGARRDGVVYFMAAVVPHLLPAGAWRVEFELFE